MKIMYSVLELKFHLSPADKVNNMISNIIGRESTIDSAEIVFIQFVLSHVISSRLISGYYTLYLCNFFFSSSQ